MQNTFNDLCEDMANYIRYGKTCRYKKVENLMQQLDALDHTDKILLRRQLDLIQHTIFSPDPTSFPPYLLLISQHGTEALKRASIMTFLVSAGNFSLQTESSMLSSFVKGMLAGVTMFSASLVYDSQQTSWQKQFQRLQLFKNRLPNINEEPIKLKFSHS